MQISLFLPNWIGDVVMATPAMRAIRQTFPNARVTAVMKPYVRDVVAGLDWFDDIVTFDKSGPFSQRWWSAGWSLRNKDHQMSILFPNTLRSALMAWLSGAQRRIGYKRYGRDAFLTDRLDPIRGELGAIKPSPIIDAYNLLAETAGATNPGYHMQLATSETDERHADDVWQTSGFSSETEVICLNPGAAYGAAKHWSNEKFATVAQRLVDERGSGILILCGPKEKEQARQIQRLANRPTVHSLADHAVSLGLTKACVRRCQLLITTDSGPRHFAAAFDRPVVSLFGPTHIPWTITYYEKEICLQKEVPCGPCQLRVCPLDHRCMTELSCTEVMGAAMELLEKEQGRTTSDRKLISLDHVDRRAG